MELFPSVPEDLEAVSTDELQGILEEFKRIGADLKADIARPVEERELIPAEATATEVTEALQAAVADRKRVEEALAGKAEAEAAFLEELDEGLAALGVESEASSEMAAESEEPEPEPEPDPEDEGAEVAVVAEATPALAAEVEPEPEPEPPAKRLAIPAGPARFDAPTSAPSAKGALVATNGLGVIKVREGTELTREAYANSIIEMARRMGPVKHVRGGSEDRFGVAKVEFPFPDEMKLHERDAAGNLEKIKAFSSTFLGEPSEIEVFMAAGGICAPPTPFYEVPGFASRARPVRDALPSFNAARGGISVPSVNIVDRTDAGVTIIEESEDAQGGTFSVKACRAVECATWTDTFVGIISHCLEVGNLNARTWPEGVALENDNLMAGWAAAADTRLLNRIKALSVKSHTVHVYNAVHDFIYAIVRAKASIRSNLRAEMGAGYTALVPEYVQELLVADLAAQSGSVDRYVAISQVEAYLSRLGVTVSWYKDSPTTGVSQVFGTQADDGLADPAVNSLDNFPAEAQIALFLNGTFLHLDAGSLELGLVRDSTLNETNDYQLFGESFENVARIGPAQAARWLTLEVCPSGEFPALTTALSC